MSDQLGHKAEKLLRDVAEIVNDAGDSGNSSSIESALRYAALWTPHAQALATLALVEEQRTANLIAFGEVAWRGASLDPEAATRLFCEIRDRLGLS